MARRVFLSIAALLAAAAGARASDPVGIYALIDKAELEPSVGQPDRIRLYGVFSLLDLKSRRYTYTAPQRGFMYFTLARGKEAVCRREWADLRKLAGTGQVVAFGGGYSKPLGTVHSDNVDKTKVDPTPYPVGIGPIKVPDKYPQAKALKAARANEKGKQ